MMYLEFVHPSIDFEKIRTEIKEFDIKTESEKNAFRLGWMGAILSLGHHVSHDVNPLRKIERPSGY